MQAKSKIGTEAAALKNKVMFIVAFMIAFLSFLFSYTMLEQSKDEIQRITRIYDDLFEKYYNINKKYAIPAYRSLAEQLAVDKEAVRALENRDSQNLSQLTTQFFKSLTRRKAFFREVNWYFPNIPEPLKHFSKSRHSEHPSTVTPLPKDVIRTGKNLSGFVIGGSGMTYRIIVAVKHLATITDKPQKTAGALEFVLDPGLLLSGVPETLGLEAVIMVKNQKVETNPQQAFRNPSRIWHPLDHSYFYLHTTKSDYAWVDHISPPQLEKLDEPLEVSTGERHYLLHRKIDLTDIHDQSAGYILWARDITSLKKSMDTSFYKMIGTSIVVLIAIFFILYFSFSRMASRLITRDLQLETINREMQTEIADREAMERELKTHRDHLEELIAEGTMELEIKSQEIEANEMKLRTVTSSIQDAILMVDRSGKVLFWNEATEVIFGFNEDEIPLKNFFQHIIQIGDYERFRSTFTEAIKPGESQTYGRIVEIECHRKNGEIFPVEMLISEVKIQDETNLIILIRDVTIKKEEETQKRILLRAVEQSNVGIQISDTEGIIQYVNPKFTEITGYQRDEVIGKPTNILKSDFNPEEDYKRLWDTITAGKDWQGELYNRRKDGSLYWDATLISPIKDPNGKITHFVAVKEDITERKNMEVELMTAKEAAEAASRSKGEFLANMSHEIRTPMNAIMGMTELALGTNLTVEQREYLEIAAQASKSLLKLLNDILDFSKVDAGRLVLENKPFRLRKALGEMVKTLALQAHEKGLELIYYIDSDVPDKFKGDVSRLRQIVVNLIGNAVKFTDAGEIVLKIDVLEDNIDNKILLHFIISDTGIGIPEEQLNIVFEKFSQADSSNTRKYGGTGLGLAISAKLVELMGGVIWAESPATFLHSNPQGPGSTFHFTSLFQLCQPREEKKDREILAKLKGLSLLIIDQNETNRKFIQELFARNGLRPETAGSGEEALQLLQNANRQYQLLILDFRMPDIDGPTLLNKIRQELQIALPILLTTSGIKSEELLQFKSQKADAHLLKPLNPEELFNAMLKAMGHEVIETSKPKLPEIQEENKEKVYYTILVAEDNLINQRLIRRLLEKEGHRVDIASDGNQAVKLFTQKTKHNTPHYHIILMDIQMPNMDGMEATGLIREIDQDIPIIALTAHAMKGDKGKFLSRGMNDYVSKPIDKNILFETINRLLNPKEKE